MRHRYGPSRSQPGQKPSTPGSVRLSFIHARMKQGMSYADALREVNEKFDIVESPATVTSTRQVVRVYGIADNGGYPIEIIPDEIEVGAHTFPSVAGGEYYNTVIGVDEGIPGSDRTAISIISGGKVVDTFVVTREGDELVVRAEDGSILGKCRSKEKFMEILHTISVQQAVEELPEEDPLEDVSRFDIIEIE